MPLSSSQANHHHTSNPPNFSLINYPLNHGQPPPPHQPTPPHPSRNVYHTVTAAAAAAALTPSSSIKPTSSNPLQQQPATFVSKLFRMVSDPQTNHMIHWSPVGDTFLVTKPDAFAKEILPLYFKHNNFSSFVRQLNMYGFHKVPHLQQGVLVLPQSQNVDMSWEFRHESFQRDKSDQLVFVKRKLPEEKNVKSSVGPSLASTSSSNSTNYIKSNINSLPNDGGGAESSLSTALVPANNPTASYSYPQPSQYNANSPAYPGYYDMPIYNNIINTENSNQPGFGSSIPDGTLCPTNLTGLGGLDMGNQQQQYDISASTGYPSASSPFLIDNNTNLSTYNYGGGLSANASSTPYSYSSGLLHGGPGSFDMGILLNELSAIKQKQNNIQHSLNTLENNQSFLHHELGYLKDRYNTQQGTMDKLLRFLANVFISGSGGIASRIGSGNKPTPVVVGNTDSSILPPVNLDTAMIKKVQTVGTSVDPPVSSTGTSSSGSSASGSANQAHLVQAFLQAFHAMTAPSGIDHPLEELHDHLEEGEEDMSVQSLDNRVNSEAPITMSNGLNLENSIISEKLNYSPSHGNHESYQDATFPTKFENYSAIEKHPYKEGMNEIDKIFSGDNALPVEYVFSTSSSPSPQPNLSSQEPLPSKQPKRLKSSSDISKDISSLFDNVLSASPSASSGTSMGPAGYVSGKNNTRAQVVKEVDPRFMALDDSQVTCPSFIQENQLATMANESSIDHRYLRNPTIDPHLSPHRPETFINLNTISSTSIPGEGGGKYHPLPDLQILRENTNAVQHDLDVLDNQVAGLRNFIGYSSPSPSPTSNGSKRYLSIGQDPYPLPSEKRTVLPFTSPLPNIGRNPNICKPSPDLINYHPNSYSSSNVIASTNPTIRDHSDIVLPAEDTSPSSLLIDENYLDINQIQEKSYSDDVQMENT